MKIEQVDSAHIVQKTETETELKNHRKKSKLDSDVNTDTYPALGLICTLSQLF